ncbi:metal-dependent hydrolase [bacterium]|nr:metal-dependent hydrolase [bacterium]
MFILGHVGLTCGAVHAIDREADLRFVPIFALLPDLLDKPLDLLLPGFTNGWTRTIGHSLSASAVFSLVVFLWKRKKSWPWILAYGLHLALDRMWMRDTHTLFWPFQGFSFDVPWTDEQTLRHLLDPWVGGGEIAGLLVLVALFVRGRLWNARAKRAFLATGVLAKPSGRGPDLVS